MDFIMPLLSIIMIDLVLAGDNAVVIALASRNLPVEQRKKAIYWGTFGAVIVRIALTLVAVWLLKVPLVQAIGGIFLVFVAMKLARQEKHPKDIHASGSLGQAIKTIIIADGIMGIDNVLAVAGAAHGNMALIVIGLVISVPIVVWGSKLLAEWMHRYPIIIHIGVAILAWTAGVMLVSDKVAAGYLDAIPMFRYVVPSILVVWVLLYGKLKSRSVKIIV